ncbi:glycoside hydrolase family 3 protein, partial [Micromonospora sp. CPCC 205371]|nr:glycoside hydrolase family 3 protein [Micromonospora sp. CPCC 205371]
APPGGGPRPPPTGPAGAHTPWGVAPPLRTRMPGTTAVRLSAADPEAALHPARGRPLVIVVRDIHRYWWMSHAVATLLAVRPDAVVVEMGVPERVTGAVHLATYGATWACGQAAAEVLAGSV